jgi:hypothetical protein
MGRREAIADRDPESARLGLGNRRWRDSTDRLDLQMKPRWRARSGSFGHRIA